MSARDGIAVVFNSPEEKERFLDWEENEWDGRHMIGVSGNVVIITMIDNSQNFQYRRATSQEETEAWKELERRSRKRKKKR